ncbi:MAG: inosine/xanthosine triphosphatase [Aeropyrum sp.]|nr:inosine/xanthosine triphosphatase [Aeropyrum sp.]
MPVNVAVGTSNPIKVRAVERVFSRFYDASVAMVKVVTSVGSQPVGLTEVMAGALERAVKSLRSSSHDFGVGVEAGPITFPSSSGYLETQIAVVVDRECRASVGLSPSFELDKRIVELMIVGVELEKAAGISRIGGLGEGVGFVGVASLGTLSRQELTEQAVLMALLPRLAGQTTLASVRDVAEQAGVSFIDC